MNFIFFSPHFPQNSTEFCFYLKAAGANVLGIGDAEYSALNGRLKSALTEYYKVSNLEDYGQILRAVGFFTHKYGKIDRFESLNEYWLETEAAIRTDFNIYGTKNDFIGNLKHKSRMKAFFAKGGVASARCLKTDSKQQALDFINTVGYPVIVKPDTGSGASLTYKITDEKALETFLGQKSPGIEFIIEEFVDGIILTYDGLIDREGRVLFDNSHQFEQSVMEVVNRNDNLYYICLPDVDARVRRAGQSILKAFDVRERFFHIELFERRSDREIVALEVNMRPPGAWMPDAINFSHDINIYQAWAEMVVKNEAHIHSPNQYFTGYASRKNWKAYRYGHNEILNQYGNQILYYHDIEPVFSRAMGNFAYLFRTKSYHDVKEIITYIQAEKAHADHLS
jgi:hypothetical protein